MAIFNWNVYIIKCSSCWPHWTWVTFCCQHHSDSFLLHAWSSTCSLGNPLARIYNVPAYQCSSSTVFQGITTPVDPAACDERSLVLSHSQEAQSARQTINSISIWKDETVLQGIIAFSHLSIRSWEHCCLATPFSNLNQLQISASSHMCLDVAYLVPAHCSNQDQQLTLTRGNIGTFESRLYLSWFD